MRSWQGREVGVRDGAGSLGRGRSRNKGLFGDNPSCAAGEHQCGDSPEVGDKDEAKGQAVNDSAW